MAGKRRVIAPEKLAQGRFLYERTSTPMDEIARALGISRATLRQRVKEWCWERSAPDSSAASREQNASIGDPTPAPPLPTELPAAPEERIALVARVQHMVERQIDAVEALLPTPATHDEAERNGRALAGLLRTLRELKRLDAPPAPSESADDHDMPYDIEELRRELSRKLETLVAGREGAVRSEP